MNQILLATPNQSFLSTCEAFVVEQGLEIETATSALACVERIRNELPDLVVLHMNLLWGGCTGVLEWLSKQPLQRNTPVVLLCDSTDREQAEALKQHAVDDWLLPVEDVLCEPVTPEQLVRTAASIWLRKERFFMRAFGVDRIRPARARQIG